MPHADPETNRRYQRAYSRMKRADPAFMLAQNHRLSLDQARDALAKKPETCEICDNKKRLEYDHCHESKQHRGWLCHLCNTAMGMFKDDPALLESAVRYLRR